MVVGEYLTIQRGHTEGTGTQPTTVDAEPSRKNTIGPGGGLKPAACPTMLLSSLPDQTTFKTIRDQQDHGCFARTVFGPLPAEGHLIQLMEGAMSDVDKLYPLLTAESCVMLVHQQLAAGSDNCHDNPARWATVNALIAMGIQWKTANKAFEELLPIPWAYFKNAFCVFPELIIQGTDIQACQAVLAMAMFMQGTADSRTTSHFIATAVRLLQTIGLHRREPYHGMDLTVAEEHRRVVWIAYILNSDAMMKYGLPSAFGDDELDIELPSEVPTDGLGIFILSRTQTPINFLRFTAELSVIQSRIHRRIYSERVAQQTPTELLDAVADLDQQLEIWKSGLPLEIRPTYNRMLSSSELEIPVLQLHFAYYNVVGKVHTAVTGLGHLNESDIVRSGSLDAGREHPNMLLSSQIRLAAARATLLLLRNMPPQPLAYIW